MSYGESTLLPDYGRFVDLVNEVLFLNLLFWLGLQSFTYLFDHALKCAKIRL